MTSKVDGLLLFILGAGFGFIGGISFVITNLK